MPEGASQGSGGRAPGRRAHLPTERPLPTRPALDRMSAAQAFTLFDDADARVAGAVAEARASILAAIELVVDRWRRGGRLLYVGAGTSGRLGVLDAVECPPTFGTDPERVQGRLAGGRDALWSAVEGAEDSREGGALAVQDAGESDVVFGITAGGTTPFVHGAIDAARERGAATVFLACVPADEVADGADVSIRLATGPEVLAGSTRLKAATATKMVLNRVTTIAMARVGRVVGDRMVGLAAKGNAKLEDRATRILAELADLGEEQAAVALGRAGGRLEVALLVQRLGITPEEAAQRLARLDGDLTAALSGPDGDGAQR